MYVVGKCTEQVSRFNNEKGFFVVDAPYRGSKFTGFFKVIGEPYDCNGNRFKVVIPYIETTTLNRHLVWLLRYKEEAKMTRRDLTILLRSMQIKGYQDVSEISSTLLAKHCSVSTCREMAEDCNKVITQKVLVENKALVNRLVYLIMNKLAYPKFRDLLNNSIQKHTERIEDPEEMIRKVKRLYVPFKMTVILNKDTLVKVSTKDGYCKMIPAFDVFCWYGTKIVGISVMLSGTSLDTTKVMFTPSKNLL